MFNCRDDLIYYDILCKWERPTVLCQLCYRIRALEWLHVNVVPLFLFVLMCNYKWLEEHLTSAPLPRENRWRSGLEHNPKTRQTQSKFQDYTLTFWKKSSPPLTLPSEAARVRQREKNKFIKPHRVTRFYVHNVTLTRRLSSLLEMFRYLHSQQCLRWISISLDVVFGTATDAAHLQERTKTFQVIFYNPGDWTQLPCNKLMDTLKIFGHFTVAVNGVFHTTLGVPFALLKEAFTLFKFICQHTVHLQPRMKELQKLTAKITCKQNKNLGKPWWFKVLFHAGKNAKKLPGLIQ